MHFCWTQLSKLSLIHFFAARGSLAWSKARSFGAAINNKKSKVGAVSAADPKVDPPLPPTQTMRVWAFQKWKHTRGARVEEVTKSPILKFMRLEFMEY